MGEGLGSDGLGSKRRKLNEGYAEDEDEYDDEDDGDEDEEDYQYGSKPKPNKGASNNAILPNYGNYQDEEEGLVQSDDQQE
jgi:hypothetical protein